ncbi:hypothetical protein [Caminibacter pacificus]|jgi:hypothetical protein
MKRVALIIPFLFLGCAISNNVNIQKNLQEVKIEKKLIDKYQISKEALIPTDDGYLFTLPTNDGIAIYKLNKNYDLVQKKVFPLLLDVKKMKYINGKIYIVGYDQNKNRPALLVVDKDLKSYTLKHFANKYDLPDDFIVKNKKIAVLLNTFKNHNPDIELYINGKTIIYPNPNSEHGKFLIEKDGGYYIIGSTQHPGEDLLIMFVKNGKIVWSKTYDFGMSDSPKNVIIKDGKIKIDVISQDYMGAQREFFITIDDKGNIIKIKKGIEFKALPTKFRT